MKKLLSINEAAEMLNIKVTTLYKWRHEKKIPFVKMGNKLRFQEDQLIKFIEENTFLPD